MQGLLSYARASEEDYGFWLIDVRISDFLEDIMFCMLLAADYSALYTL